MIYIKILIIFEYLFIVDIYFMYKKKNKENNVKLCRFICRL